MMREFRTYFVLTAVMSLGLGVLAIIPIVQSDNGYLAGFAFLPILILIALISLFIGIAGLIMLALKKEAGPFLLIAALLIPMGFFGSALTAKFLELGSYREAPMVSFMPEISNVVIFKKGTSREEIDRFWNQTLSLEREDGRGRHHLPGISGMGSLQLGEDHEAIEFHFFGNATEEQKEAVYSRVRSSPIVEELRQDVTMKEYRPVQEEPSASNDQRPKKVVNSN